MILTITPTESIGDIRRRLNVQKHHLEKRKDARIIDWLDLATQYAAIDARANYAYCMTEADKLIAKAARIDPDDFPTDENESMRIDT